MILPGINKDSPPEQQPLLREGNSSEGPSSLPPPSFEESVGNTSTAFDDATDSSPAGGDEPPDFTPYDAEHWISDGEIISHDSHLNEDGEALYRFLLSQAEIPPKFFVHCRSMKTEKRTRTVEKTDSEGRQYTVKEKYTDVAIDFDFQIECQVPPRATQWTVGDDEPVYRGGMYREVGPPGGTTSADYGTTEKFEAWAAKRRKCGLPPWVGRGPPNDRPDGTGVGQHPRNADTLRSSWTLRQWADDYCQSPKIFKEFIYEKVIYNWDLNTLEAAIRAAIKSTNYVGNNVEVFFESEQKTVIVRPNTFLSRAMSMPLLAFILTITLIYPSMWLFRYLHPHGGGRWTVGGGAYALKRWVPEPQGEMQGVAGGRRMLIGEREGEWFKRWEATIRQSVVTRNVGRKPMSEPYDAPLARLDGYT